MRTLHAGLFPVASSKMGKCLDCGAEGAVATAGVVAGFLVCAGAWPADETLALASVAATPRVSKEIRRNNIPRMRIPREGGRHKSGVRTKMSRTDSLRSEVRSAKTKRRRRSAPPAYTERKLVKGRWIVVGPIVSIAVPISVVVTAVVAIPALAVVVAPVARPLAPFAIVAVHDFKVGPAATIHPDTVAVVTPGAVENTVGLTALADDEDAVTRVHGAEIAVHVIGGAVDQCSRFRLPVPGNAEVGSAAAIRPDSALAIAPSLTFDAGGLAALPNQLDSKARIGRAPDAFHGVRGAINHVRIAPAPEFVFTASEFAFVVLIAIRFMISVMVSIVVSVMIAVLDDRGG